MIICGFPGVGKSMLAKFHGGWVDLESTPFAADWERYAKVAIHMSRQGYNVLVSTHKELLEKLDQYEERHIVVLPHFKDNTVYRQRYIARGNDNKFIEKIMQNWNDWIADILNTYSVLRTVVILPRGGCLAAFIQDFEKLEKFGN